jgi:hypothetical protein
MKNCPSCKSTEVYVNHSKNFKTGEPESYRVYCPKCWLSGPQTDGELYLHDEETAIGRWDAMPRRDDPPAFHGSVYTIGERTYRVDFHHNGPITLCAITWVGKKGRMGGIQGASFCNPKDTFDPNVGERLAMKRACGIDQGYYCIPHGDLYAAWRKDQWEAMKGSEIKEPA